MKIVDNSMISKDKWDTYVLNNPLGNVYHSSMMFNAFKACEGLVPFALFALDENSQICGIIVGYIQTISKGLLSILTRRSVITQSPLYADCSTLDLLLESYDRLVKPKVVYSEIRNHFSCSDSIGLFEKYDFRYKPHLNYHVECSSLEITWKRISESKRRQIKKAVKKGVAILDDPTESQALEFYKILKDLYDNKIRKPIFAWDYFKALYDAKSENYCTKFLLIQAHDKIIGGIVCPISSTDTIHEAYIAGLDLEYKDEFPSIMATWAAIEYACIHGIGKFDFMGAGSPDDDYGVRDFKSKFGGDLVEYGRFEAIHSRAKFMIAKTGFKLMQKLSRKLW